jgi:hypothetical protein
MLKSVLENSSLLWLSALVLPKRREAVTLFEVKDALYRDYLQWGKTVVIHLPANSVYHCPCSSSQPNRCAIVIEWHGLLSSERGHRERPLLFSSWHFTQQQVASGIALTLLHWSSAPHSSQVSRGCLEKPSMKSKAESQ